MVYCSQTGMTQTHMALPARQLEARVSASGRSFSSGKGTRSSLARHRRIDEAIDETRRINARRDRRDSGAIGALLLSPLVPGPCYGPQSEATSLAGSAAALVARGWL